MTSLHNPNNGLKQLSSLPLTVMPLLHNPIKKLPTGAELHNYVHIQSILKGTLNSHDIWVLRQVVHYLNLPPHILVILAAEELLLGNGLAGVGRARGFLRAEMSGPELALPQLLADGVELLKRRSPVRPVTMLLYPLYASVVAIETTSKLDDEQWLAYWILYSFLTLMEMLLEPMLQWIPIWYDVKLLFVAWLVLPQFRGAAFIYDKLVREKLIKRYGAGFLQQQQQKSPNGKAKTKTKFVDFITPKKSEHEVS
nr:HVA22-like protein E [Ipomoea batatas]